jgi:hypothetical protein
VHLSDGRLSAAWREAWKDAELRVQMVATAFSLFAALGVLAAFLNGVERRPGVRLPDPLLEVVAPHDTTWLIFSLIYLSLVVGLTVLAFQPRAMVIGVQAYVVMVLTRVCAMYFVALDPPVDAIPLRDPLIELLGTGHLLTRDLFFSGHTSTLFLLFLAVPDRRYKLPLLACTICVAAGVLRQHVHYTIDVIVAPLFAYASYRAVVGAHERLRRGPAIVS